MSLYGYLAHYGTPRHSGRYPWGSGDRPYQSGGGPFTKKKSSSNIAKKSVVVTSGKGETRTVSIPKLKNAAETVRATAREVYKKRDQYTNDELKAIIDRLGYEQRLIEIGAKQKSAGRKWVESVLSDSSKSMAKTTITRAYNKVLTDILDDKK